MQAEVAGLSLLPAWWPVLGSTEASCGVAVRILLRGWEVEVESLRLLDVRVPLNVPGAAYFPRARECCEKLEAALQRSLEGMELEKVLPCTLSAVDWKEAAELHPWDPWVFLPGAGS